MIIIALLLITYPLWVIIVTTYFLTSTTALTLGISLIPLRSLMINFARKVTVGLKNEFDRLNACNNEKYNITFIVVLYVSLMVIVISNL